eukprot:1137176-Pelagomonas_calceolata.AAC.1
MLGIGHPENNGLPETAWWGGLLVALDTQEDLGPESGLQIRPGWSMGQSVGMLWDPSLVARLQWDLIFSQVVITRSQCVWNTAARVHSNNQNHTWLQDLAKAIPEAKWIISNISKGPQRSASDITVKAPCQSHPNLQLTMANWRSWAYTDGSCQVQNGKT